MKRIRPKNWHEFQHYNNRSPVWIKLHKRLLNDYQFQKLPVDSRALAPMLWLLASEYENGDIPGDVRDVAFRVHLTLDELAKAFEPLLRAGFFDIIDEDGNTLSRCYTVASLEKEIQETSIEEKEPLSDFQSDPLPPSEQAPKAKAAKAAYSSEFEEFWKAYPTDKLMSKAKAGAYWRKLSPEDRALAIAAIPGFRDHCRKNPTYRAVHAVRFLSERRFEGFVASSADPAKAAEARDRADQFLKRGKYAETMQ